MDFYSILMSLSILFSIIAASFSFARILKNKKLETHYNEKIKELLQKNSELRNYVIHLKVDPNNVTILHQAQKMIDKYQSYFLELDKNKDLTGLYQPSKRGRIDYIAKLLMKNVISNNVIKPIKFYQDNEILAPTSLYYVSDELIRGDNYDPYHKSFIKQIKKNKKGITIFDKFKYFFLYPYLAEEHYL